ncbi:hypothetical protein S245_001268 [Arachis hypogaea]
MGDKLHRREGNSPDHQLRPLNDRSVIKEVGVQRQPGGLPRSSFPISIPISRNQRFDFLLTNSSRPTGQGTISGRQFLWGVGLQKGNGGVQRFPRARRRLALECKGRRELDCKTHPSSRDESRP